MFTGNNVQSTIPEDGTDHISMTIQSHFFTYRTLTGEYVLLFNQSEVEKCSTEGLWTFGGTPWMRSDFSTKHRLNQTLGVTHFDYDAGVKRWGVSRIYFNTRPVVDAFWCFLEAKSSLRGLLRSKIVRRPKIERRRHWLEMESWKDSAINWRQRSSDGTLVHSVRVDGHTL